jgi:hypothetical protein
VQVWKATRHQEAFLPRFDVFLRSKLSLYLLSWLSEKQRPKFLDFGAGVSPSRRRLLPRFVVVLNAGPFPCSRRSCWGFDRLPRLCFIRGKKKNHKSFLIPAFKSISKIYV